jgi:hypothetical protein
MKKQVEYFQRVGNVLYKGTPNNGCTNCCAGQETPLCYALHCGKYSFGNITKKDLNFQPVGEITRVKSTAYYAVEAWIAFRNEPKLTNVPDGGYVYMDRRMKHHLAMMKLAKQCGFTEKQILGEEDGTFDECTLCEHSSHVELRSAELELQRLREKNGDLECELNTVDSTLAAALKPRSLGEEIELEQFLGTWNRIRMVY